MQQLPGSLKLLQVLVVRPAQREVGDEPQPLTEQLDRYQRTHSLVLVRNSWGLEW